MRNNTFMTLSQKIALPLVAALLAGGSWAGPEIPNFLQPLVWILPKPVLSTPPPFVVGPSGAWNAQDPISFDFGFPRTGSFGWLNDFEFETPGFSMFSSRSLFGTWDPSSILKIRQTIDQFLDGSTSLEGILQHAKNWGVSESDLKTAIFNPILLPKIMLNSVDQARELRTLGRLFASDPRKLEDLFSLAIALSDVKLSPQQVAASIESGCGTGCLPAAVVAAAASNSAGVLRSPAPPASSTTSTGSSGGGSGGSRPISPTG
jgi:hypothetical protein